MPTSISFFFPAFNEEGNLGPMVDAALAVLPLLAPRFEILIVNDGSQDGTGADADALAALHPEVRHLKHETNLGYGEALRTGISNSTMDAICYTDGDQQFDLKELAQLWPLLGTSDVVAGYRIKRNDPAHRLFIAWTYNRLIRLMFGLRAHDVDCAFKLMRRDVANEVHPASGGAFFSAEFLLRANHLGFRVVEVGVHHYPRLIGRPKGATPRVIIRTVRDMLRLRRRLSTIDQPALSVSVGSPEDRT